MGFRCDIENLSCGYLSFRELAPGSACPEHHERQVKSAQGETGVGAAKTGESVALGRTWKREG